MRSTSQDGFARGHVALASAVDAALVEQARKNELAIAIVRAVGYTLYGLAYLAAVVDPRGAEEVPSAVALYAAGAAIGSGAFAVLLSRGWYHRLILWITPLADTALIFGAVATSVRSFGPQHYAETGGWVMIALGCALLIVGGALRLSRNIALMSGLSALLMYLLFALWLTSPPNILVHFPPLFGIVLASHFLTHSVQRAVTSEVGKLVLRRFLPMGVVSRAHSDPLALLRAPRSTCATIMMTDLRGFTGYAEGRRPEEVLDFLSLIQGELASIVSNHGGSVDKFMGGGMLAEFGAVDVEKDHAHAALRAASAMLERVDGIASEVEADLRLGIGIHTGEVVAGCIGGADRLEFTVIGDAVNVASRLEGLTKDMGVSVLVSETTVEQLREVGGEAMASLLKAGDVQLRGRVQHLAVYTLKTGS